MGNNLSKKISPGLLHIERLIGNDIMIGINEYGECLLFEGNVYKLIDTKKYSDKIEFYFESNILLTFQKINEINEFDKNKLFYKLIQDRSVYVGELVLPYKKISLNSSHFDLLDEMQ